MTTKLKRIALILVVSALGAQADAVPSFTVSGTESKTFFRLTFGISDDTGTALASQLWTSGANIYHKEGSDPPTPLSLMYWDVKFTYDLAMTKVHVEAFHKIDPHNDKTDKGGTFTWDAVRPAATRAVGRLGAKRGFDNTTQYFHHTDSKGKHSNQYDAQLIFTTGQSSPPTYQPVEDILTLEITGEHRAKPVPDPASTAPLLAGCLLALLAIGLNRKRRAR